METQKNDKSGIVGIIQQGIKDLEKWNPDLVERRQKNDSQIKTRCPIYKQCNFPSRAFKLSIEGGLAYRHTICLSDYKACGFYKIHKENIDQIKKGERV